MTTYDSWPECSLKYAFLLSSEFARAAADVEACKHIGSLITELGRQLDKEGQLMADDSEALTAAQAKLKLGSHKGAQKCVQELLNRILPFKFVECMGMLEETLVAEKLLEGQDVVVLVGETGSGKSTLTHHLAGSKLERVDNAGRGAYAVVKGTAVKDALKSVNISAAAQSETRFVTAVPINFDELKDVTKKRRFKKGEMNDGQEGFVVADTPGFNDTRGVEFDVANGLGVSAALQKAKSVRMVLVWGPATFGERGEKVLDLLSIVSKIIPAASQYTETFTYIFNKFTEEELAPEQYVSKRVKENLETPPATHRDNATVMDLLRAVDYKTEDGALGVFQIKPQASDRVRLIESIVATDAIEDPSKIKFSASQKSLSAIDAQLAVYKTLVSHSLSQFPKSEKDELRNYLGVVKSILDELFEATGLIDLVSVKNCYTECAKMMVATLKEITASSKSEFARVFAEQMSLSSVRPLAASIQFISSAESELEQHFAAADATVSFANDLVHVRNELFQRAVTTAMTEATLASKLTDDTFHKICIMTTIFPAEFAAKVDPLVAELMKAADFACSKKISKSVLDLDTATPVAQVRFLDGLVATVSAAVAMLQGESSAAESFGRGSFFDSVREHAIKLKGYAEKAVTALVEGLDLVKEEVLKAVTASAGLSAEAASIVKRQICYLLGMAAQSRVNELRRAADAIGTVSAAVLSHVDAVVDGISTRVENLFRGDDRGKSFPEIGTEMKRLNVVCNDFGLDVQSRTTQKWQALLESVAGYMRQTKNDLDDLIKRTVGDDLDVDIKRLSHGLQELRDAAWINVYRPGMLAEVLDGVNHQIMFHLQKKVEALQGKNLQNQFDESERKLVRDAASLLGHFTKIESLEDGIKGLQELRLDFESWLKNQILDALLYIRIHFSRKEIEQLKEFRACVKKCESSCRAAQLQMVELLKDFKDATCMFAVIKSPIHNAFGWRKYMLRCLERERDGASLGEDGSGENMRPQRMSSYGGSLSEDTSDESMRPQRTSSSDSFFDTFKLRYRNVCSDCIPLLKNETDSDFDQFRSLATQFDGADVDGQASTQASTFADAYVRMSGLERVEKSIAVEAREELLKEMAEINLFDHSSIFFASKIYNFLAESEKLCKQCEDSCTGKKKILPSDVMKSTRNAFEGYLKGQFFEMATRLDTMWVDLENAVQSTRIWLNFEGTQLEEALTYICAVIKTILNLESMPAQKDTILHFFPEGKQGSRSDSFFLKMRSMHRALQQLKIDWTFLLVSENSDELPSALPICWCEELCGNLSRKLRLISENGRLPESAQFKGIRKDFEKEEEKFRDLKLQMLSMKFTFPLNPADYSCSDDIDVSFLSFLQHFHIDDEEKLRWRKVLLSSFSCDWLTGKVTVSYTQHIKTYKRFLNKRFVWWNDFLSGLTDELPKSFETEKEQQGVRKTWNDLEHFLTICSDEGFPSEIEGECQCKAQLQRVREELMRRGKKTLTYVEHLTKTFKYNSAFRLIRCLEKAFQEEKFKEFLLKRREGIKEHIRSSFKKFKSTPLDELEKMRLTASQFHRSLEEVAEKGWFVDSETTPKCFEELLEEKIQSLCQKMAESAKSSVGGLSKEVARQIRTVKRLDLPEGQKFFLQHQLAEKELTMDVAPPADHLHQDVVAAATKAGVNVAEIERLCDILRNETLKGVLRIFERCSGPINNVYPVAEEAVEKKVSKFSKEIEAALEGAKRNPKTVEFKLGCLKDLSDLFEDGSDAHVAYSERIKDLKDMVGDETENIDKGLQKMSNVSAADSSVVKELATIRGKMKAVMEFGPVYLKFFPDDEDIIEIYRMYWTRTMHILATHIGLIDSDVDCNLVDTPSRLFNQLMRLQLMAKEGGGDLFPQKVVRTTDEAIQAGVAGEARKVEWLTAMDDLCKSSRAIVSEAMKRHCDKVDATVQLIVTCMGTETKLEAPVQEYIKLVDQARVFMQHCNDDELKIRGDTLFKRHGQEPFDLLTEKLESSVHKLLTNEFAVPIADDLLSTLTFLCKNNNAALQPVKLNALLEKVASALVKFCEETYTALQDGCSPGATAKGKQDEIFAFDSPLVEQLGQAESLRNKHTNVSEKSKQSFTTCSGVVRSYLGTFQKETRDKLDKGTFAKPENKFSWRIKHQALMEKVVPENIRGTQTNLGVVIEAIASKIAHFASQFSKLPETNLSLKVIFDTLNTRSKAQCLVGVLEGQLDESKSSALRDNVGLIDRISKEVLVAPLQALAGETGVKVNIVSVIAAAAVIYGDELNGQTKGGGSGFFSGPFQKMLADSKKLVEVKLDNVFQSSDKAFEDAKDAVKKLLDPKVADDAAYNRLKEEVAAKVGDVMHFFDQLYDLLNCEIARHVRKAEKKSAFMKDFFVDEPDLLVTKVFDSIRTQLEDGLSVPQGSTPIAISQRTLESRLFLAKEMATKGKHGPKYGKTSWPATYEESLGKIQTQLTRIKELAFGLKSELDAANRSNARLPLPKPRVSATAHGVGAQKPKVKEKKKKKKQHHYDY